MDVLSLDPAIGDNGRRFAEYVLDNYFEGAFPQELWNHFDTVGERTINRVEGDNNRMKKFCGSANPDIGKAVDLLRLHEQTAALKFKNAMKANAKAPPQQTYDHQKDIEFRQMRSLFREGKINLKKLLDRYCQCIFVRP